MRTTVGTTSFSHHIPANRDTADLLLDSARLSHLVGRPVRATRLRHKPGLSTVAALVPGDGSEDKPTGWAQAVTHGHRDKVRNAVRRAAEVGGQVRVTSAEPSTGDRGLQLVHGDLDSDPRLQHGLAVLRQRVSLSAGLAAGELQVLRYNPFRRLVLRLDKGVDSPVVIRVTAGEQHPHPVLRAAAAAGVPVLQPQGPQLAPHPGRVSVWPWYGNGQLRSQAAAIEAGIAVAGLHQVPAAELAESGHWDGIDPAVALTPLIRDLANLDPAAAGWMVTLTARLAQSMAGLAPDPVVIHGDFSADQVLVGSSGIRLIDFDRSGIGPVASDLGSFAAVEMVQRGTAGPPEAMPVTGALLAGYRRGGGAVPRPEELRLWAAHRLLSKVTEPFRAGRADWRHGIHRRLEQVAAVIQ